MEFDTRGNLKPYIISEISFEKFKTQFVDSFSDNSTRLQLFSKYNIYLQEILKITTQNFNQWIDGSFISIKHHPKDIDLVSILDYRDYESNLGKIEKELIANKARKLFGVDAYIVPKYPENHKKYIFTHSDLLYWENLFSKTKVSRSKKQFQKGFIQINFSQNE